jgi:prepilin-type N-terminal cleavage/methylation domain-containing protein
MRNKGFTLVEIIFSVALISIIGLIIGKVFIGSWIMNIKAIELDYSTNISTNIIELISARIENKKDYLFNWTNEEDGTQKAVFNYDKNFIQTNNDNNIVYEIIVLKTQKSNLICTEINTLRIIPYPLSFEKNIEINSFESCSAILDGDLND